MVRLHNFWRAFAASIRDRDLSGLLHEARRRFHSDWLHYGLMRDLGEPFVAPLARVQLTIRPIQESDRPALLAMNADQMSARGPYVRMHRLNFLEAGIGQCYVAATDDDEPCYMQCLMSSSENASIYRYFAGNFQALAPDEALLEYAFTPERYQGKGIMPAAMALIAEKARDFGARRVITFVDHENIPALKGCQRSGFSPYLIRYDHWRLFRRRVSFERLPPGTPYPFETEQPGRAATANQASSTR